MGAATRSSLSPRSPCGERHKHYHSPQGHLFSTHAPLAGSDGGIVNGITGPASFNPRSPCGERRRPWNTTTGGSGFQPTLPLRGATVDAHGVLHPHAVSTHAPLAGSDILGHAQGRIFSSFQPTLPLRGATPNEDRRSLRRWVSTHAPLAGSDKEAQAAAHHHEVSTHAPLAGSDRPIQAPKSSPSRFQPTLPLRGATGLGRADERPGCVSTHAPLAGSDAFSSLTTPLCQLFQPTLPLRGATRNSARCSMAGVCFNPRSPCGERQSNMRLDLHVWLQFHPTLPLRGATGLADSVPETHPVSTHAPLAGSDVKRGRDFRQVICFNPRSPCGERRDGQGELVPSSWFQPTLPLRGATVRIELNHDGIRVSTHAPLAGSDRVGQRIT